MGQKSGQGPLASVSLRSTTANGPEMEREILNLNCPGLLDHLKGLLPYRFLVDGKITEEEYSIERGQLLLALKNSNLNNLTTRRIYLQANFKNAYLKDVILNDSDFMGIDLSGSNLRNTKLNNVDFYIAELQGIKLIASNLIYANLHTANLRKANLRHANLYGADFNNASIENANLSNTNLLKVKNLTKEQLLTTNSLFNCSGLPLELKTQLKTDKPCLFTLEGCN